MLGHVMKHRNSHLLVGYWSRLRRGRSVPDQTEINPRAIKRMLSFVFILEAQDVERPVYRLAGTGLCERFGSELKGLNFLSHWEAQSRGALVGLLEQSLRTRQPICLSSIAASLDCGMVELETILAPVSFNGGAPTRFLGMVQVLTDINALGGRPIAFERLIDSQLVREDEPMSSPADMVLPMAGRAQSRPLPVFDPLGRVAQPAAHMLAVPHPKAPHLRLVVNQAVVNQTVASAQTITATAFQAEQRPIQDLVRKLDIFGTGIAVDAS